MNTTELLWEGRSAARRGPKPALSLTQIAATGVAIADAVGLEAVSMQRIADELEFTKMSLYRYVASKSELVSVMIELAVGEPPDLAKVRGGWRCHVETWAKHLTASWQDHPWLPYATIGERTMGPREIDWVECALRPLTETRLTDAEQLDAVFLLFGHLRNTQSTATAGTQPWTDPARIALVQDHAERFPALASVVTRRLRRPADSGRAFGLARVLDGIETLHDSRS